MGCFSGLANYDGLLAVMEQLYKVHKVDFIINGGIWNADMHEYFIQKGARGTMCATFILQNPFLYE